ncbi:MAG TPA: hypothetical protein VGL53_15105 [Bryobacteraceae bacterium]|jgi:hypothetical protein
MALLTDGSPNTVGSLKAIESSIADVAAIEMINVDVKMGVAVEEISESLMVYLIQLGSQDPQAASRRDLGVSTVVVTAPLKRWHALDSIALVYRDAYHNQLNERYLAKWKYFNAVAADARQTLLDTGIGLVNQPVPKAPVPIAGLSVGQWNPASYIVQIAWVDALGNVGAPSDPITVQLSAGTAPTVTAPAPPDGIAGWNVYVGPIGSVPILQNSSPLDFTTPWIASLTEPASGTPVGTGQSPDTYILSSNCFYRR